MFLFLALSSSCLSAPGFNNTEHDTFPASLSVYNKEQFVVAMLICTHLFSQLTGLFWLFVGSWNEPKSLEYQRCQWFTDDNFYSNINLLSLSSSSKLSLPSKTGVFVVILVFMNPRTPKNLNIHKQEKTDKYLSKWYSLQKYERWWSLCE